MGSAKFGRGLEGLPSNVEVKRYVIGCGQRFRSDTSVVLADGSFKRISELRAGDLVRGSEKREKSKTTQPVNQVLVKRESGLYT